MSETEKFPSAIVWRQSVFVNDFKCNRCGALLWKDDDGTSDLLIENKPLSELPGLYCRRCGNLVARVTEDVSKND